MGGAGQKPFSPRELVARVRAVLRRRRDDDVDAGDVTGFDGLTIDAGRHEVRVGAELVELTSLEFQLLAALAASPGRVFTRRQLIEQVWGWDFYGDERLVDVHVRNLRKALGDDAGEPRFGSPGATTRYGCRFRPNPSWPRSRTT